MGINLKKICRDIGHADEDIQVLALTTVSQLTPGSIEDAADLLGLRQALERAIQGTNADTVFLARKALNKVGELERRLPPTLAGATSLPDAPGPSAPSVTREDVVAGLAVEDDPVKLATLVSQLAQVGEPVDLELAVPLLASRDARVRSNAVEVVEKLTDEKRVTELLTPLLSDGNNRVRGNVAKALGRIGVPKMAKYLEQMLRSSKLSMRESAVYALSHIRGTVMVDLLVRALKDPYEGIRLRAVNGLKIHNDERALPLLKPLMNDLDIDVCEAAHKAIKVIRKDQPPTMAGELFDIEIMAARDAEQRAAAEAEAAAAWTAPLPTAGSIDQTGGLSTTAMSTKQKTAEMLQKQAENLFAKKKSGPPLLLDGRTRMELEEMLKFELKRIGTAVMKRVRSSEISHQALSLVYYDILKVQETLKRHQERSRSEGKSESGGGFFGNIKARLGGKQPEEDPIARLEKRIEENHIILGRKAVELARTSQVDLEEDDCDRVGAIEQKLAETPEAAG